MPSAGRSTLCSRDDPFVVCKGRSVRTHPDQSSALVAQASQCGPRNIGDASPEQRQSPDRHAHPRERGTERREVRSIWISCFLFFAVGLSGGTRLRNATPPNAKMPLHEAVISPLMLESMLQIDCPRHRATTKGEGRVDVPRIRPLGASDSMPIIGTLPRMFLRSRTWWFGLAAECNDDS